MSKRKQETVSLPKPKWYKIFDPGMRNRGIRARTDSPGLRHVGQIKKPGDIVPEAWLGNTQIFNMFMRGGMLIECEPLPGELVFLLEEFPAMQKYYSVAVAQQVDDEVIDDDKHIHSTDTGAGED